MQIIEDGQPAHPRALAHRAAARRHGHDGHRGLRRRGRRHGRPRRRLALLPPARRRPERLTRDHSLVGELVRPREADRGAGRVAPAALGDHPRARARAARGGRRRGLRRPRRRPLPAVLGRPDRDGPRAQAEAADGRAAAAGAAGPRADRRRQRGRRARQHHRDPVPAGGRPARRRRRAGRRARPGARRSRRPASTTRSPARPSARRARASAAPRRTRATSDEATGADVRASDEAEAEYRASGTVALSAVRPRAQPAEEPHAHAPPPPAAPPAPGHARARALPRRPGRGADRAVAGHARGLLRRHRRAARERRHRLPRPAVRPAARHQALLGGPALGRHPRQRARRPPEDLHGPRAALPRRRGGPRQGPGERADTRSERPQPRADGADPGVAAAHRRVRGPVHPALGHPLERLADLRGDLPRAVLRRPPGDPLHAPARRPVPVPAGRRSWPASGSWSSTGSTRTSRATRRSGS